MRVESNHVVGIHYVLRDQEGEIMDQSEPGEALHYLHGHGNIIPGLESELLHKEVGNQLKVHVTPERGYGVHDPEKCFLIPRAQIPSPEIQPGVMLQLHAEDGEVLVVTVVAVDDKAVEVDGNHPMAGQDLFFEVEVASVRPATEEEIAHGHVHGPGGHHHH